MIPLLILYIDQHYHITYWIIRDEVKYFSPITIPQAIQLLKNIEFDLIISDPQNIAILKASSSDVTVPIAGKDEHNPPTRYFAK